MRRPDGVHDTYAVSDDRSDPRADLVALLDPAQRANPYPLLARLRSGGAFPLGLVPGVVVTRHGECAAVLRDPAMSSDRRNSPLFLQRIVAASSTGAVPAASMSYMQRVFLFLDPPDHTRLRRLVAKAFTPRVVESLEPRVTSLVDALLDAAAARGELDVIADLAYPLPITIISELLGVPDEHAEAVRAWSQEVSRALDPFLALTGEPAEGLPRRMAVLREMEAFFTSLVTQRRTAPRDDLLSALVRVQDGSDALTLDELLATCVLLIIAGHETTVNLIGNGVLALLRHPDVLSRLAADPSLGARVVEEVLRYDPPVQLSLRNALVDTEVGGQPVPKGGLVLLLLAAANRDPGLFADPDVFDIDRGEPRHLAFGLGSHFCLGAPLARLEGRVALTRFAQRVRAPRMLDETPAYKPHVNLRGLASLRLGFASLDRTQAAT